MLWFWKVFLFRLFLDLAKNLSEDGLSEFMAFVLFDVAEFI
jgi:hypothetical protein